MKKVISTNKAPKAIGPYSQAILSNDTLYCSGQIAIDPKSWLAYPLIYDRNEKYDSPLLPKNPFSKEYNKEPNTSTELKHFSIVSDELKQGIITLIGAVVEFVYRSSIKSILLKQDHSFFYCLH